MLYQLQLLEDKIHNCGKLLLQRDINSKQDAETFYKECSNTMKKLRENNPKAKFVMHDERSEHFWFMKRKQK